MKHPPSPPGRRKLLRPSRALRALMTTPEQRKKRTADVAEDAAATDAAAGVVATPVKMGRCLAIPTSCLRSD
jgi:hypothetical protein